MGSHHDYGIDCETFFGGTPDDIIDTFDPSPTCTNCGETLDRDAYRSDIDHYEGSLFCGPLCERAQVCFDVDDHGFPHASDEDRAKIEKIANDIKVIPLPRRETTTQENYALAIVQDGHGGILSADTLTTLVGLNLIFFQGRWKITPAGREAIKGWMPCQPEF